MITDLVRYCLRCGARLIEESRFGRLRPVCPQCGWVYFTDPKVAAGVLIVKKGQFLLVRRSNEPARGLWTLPAGFVDVGEDPREAAARECLEETGLTIQITALLDVLSGQEHPHGAHIIIFYQGRIISGKMHPGDDVDHVAFFPYSELPPLAFATTGLILTKYHHLKGS
jgi:ADP-ribose pyrophosphatase YjhB (NUDIX family)